MNTVTRLLLSVTTLGTLLVQPTLGDAEDPLAAALEPNETVESAPDLAVHGYADRNEKAIAWALSRLELAGLELQVNLEVRFHRSTEACGGWNHDGLHTPFSDRHRIDVCVIDQAGQERVLLHELAHVWAYRHLDDDERRGFLELRGLEAWNDGEWRERGTEHAAEVLRWGLGEQSLLPGRLPNHDVESLTEAFEYLTGTEPLCELDATPTQPVQARQGGPTA
jgi:hypothetical protein